MEWYEGDFNDYEGALLRTESEPPVFGDEGQREEEDMKVKIDGRWIDLPARSLSNRFALRGYFRWRRGLRF